MQDSTTICEKAQSLKHRKPSVTPDLHPHTHNSQPILNTNIEGWAQIDSIIPEALWSALQQTPPHKRAEAIEALAERGVWFTAERRHAGLAGARA